MVEPSPSRQATLGAAFELAGRGLHTNGRVRVRVEPAPPGHGVVFHRRLRHGRTAVVPALWTRRVSRPLCTALQSEDGVLVRTVEHLLASLSALQVDNARVELDAEELPIFDGGAAPWCEAIASAGRVEQEARRQVVRLREPLEVVDGRRRLRIEPAPHLAIACALQLARFPPMRWDGPITPESFVQELAPARSFGRLKWALPAKLYSYATGRPVLRGAHLGSTAAIWGGRVIGGMRVPDEPVRHRVLDLVGDLSLAGRPVVGRLQGEHVGHELNHALVAKLMSTPSAWELT